MYEVVNVEVINEVILPRRVIPQPQPEIHKGGDCGPCVLGGLLGMSVEEVYEQLGSRQAISWHGAYQFLHWASANNKLDRLIDSVPFWPSTNAQRTFGDPGWLTGQNWFQWVRMGLDAGYYGLTNYNFDGAGPESVPDHFVMFVGSRERRIEKHHKEKGDKCWSYEQDLLISCSSIHSPDEFWVEIGELLTKHGGYAMFLARPVKCD